MKRRVLLATFLSLLLPALAHAALGDGIGGSAAQSAQPSKSPETHSHFSTEKRSKALHVHGRLSTEKHIIGFLKDASGAEASECSFTDGDAPQNGLIALELVNHDPLVSHRFLLNLDGKDVEVACGISGDDCVDSAGTYGVRFAFDPHGNGEETAARTGVRGTVSVRRDGRRDSRSFDGSCRSRPPSSIP